ncbi:MAG TPA: TM0106 family RecB-like putative nuclease, partial [Verrucomicrobiae bacterium]
MTITPSLFEAFLKCPTKCWLRFANEPPSGNPYAEWVQGETESYRAAVAKQFTANMPEGECAAFCSSRREEAQTSAETLKTAKWRLAMDIVARTELGSSRGNEAQTEKSEMDQSLLTSAATIETSLHAVERIPSAGRGQPAQFVPIRFIYRNKLTKDDKLLLAFDAFVFSEMLGRGVSLGKIIHGDDRDCACSSRGNEAQTSSPEDSQSLLTSAATHNGMDEPQTGTLATLAQPQPRITKVKTPALAGEVRKRLGKITALLASPTPPDLVLNRHCAECEFQARCRKLAVEKDDLSLLAGMSAKERQKLRSKGIFTVTQLSYTFRPRRRPKRQRDKHEKYHHALKALAIREQKIHIVGSPELKLAGTPVYLDVEGLPDRDFYYLIGLRIGHGDSAVQHSLWADTVADEGKIWREFLALLETVEQPVLIHYGSYETTFLKAMKERHGGPQDESVAAKAVASAINLVSLMFARIYFPTFSNGLKDIARHLGFEWSSVSASGVQTIAWRETWSNDRESAVQSQLILYNAEDCQALDLVTQEVLGLHQARSDSQASGKRVVVDVTTLKRENAFGFKRNEFFFPELDTINKAAYWDYQREKVYVKSNRHLRQAMKAIAQPLKRMPTNKQIQCSPPQQCPFCDSAKIIKKAKAKKLVYDLKFTRSGLKRWIVLYHFYRYCCRSCSKFFYPKKRAWTGSQFGPAILAYSVYQNIELRIPLVTIDKSINKLFGLQLGIGATGNCKSRAAELYAPTYKTLLGHLQVGKLLHVDETKISVRGNDCFVWVLASLDEVAYVYTESRESDWILTFLKDFKGVLVCDF